MFGNPETTTGGRALKFYSSVRMDVRRVETLKQGGEMVGNHTRVKVVKIRWHRHLSRLSLISCSEPVFPEREIFWILQQMSIVSKRGAWYAYEGDKIGQGRENAKTYLRENPEFCKMIEEMVREHYFAQEDETPEGEEETPVSADAESKNE